MIHKALDRRSGKIRVTFELPGDTGDQVVVCGDFNDWSRTANRMAHANGRFVATVVVEPGGSYRFRYFIDNTRWENDPDADGYVGNNFGSEDAIVNT
ncbi:MAG: isoamylase early set domain-containing protein [Acidimicrobiia bacterium]